MDGWAAWAALVIVGVLMVPLPAAPLPAVTYPQTPRLFVATNASSPFAGDNVSLDITSYVGGNLTDPDAAPTIYASGSGPAAPPAFRGLARVGPGHYRAWTVLAAAPNLALQSVSTSWVTVFAYMGGTNVSYWSLISWITPGLYLRFFSNIATISTVQPMHLTAQMYNGTRLVDADTGSMRFQAVGFLGPLGAPMTPNRTAVGVYEADATLDVNASLGFTANATVHGVLVQQQLLNGAFPRYTPVPAFDRAWYQAWFQATSATATDVTGTLWVADAWGRPAPGVPVALVIAYGTVYVNATTDAEGRVPLDIPLLNGIAPVTGEIGSGAPGTIPVHAILPYTTCQEGFRGYGPGILSEADPAILPDGSLRDFLTPGATVVRRYHAVNYSAAPPAVPFATAPLAYYLVGAVSGTIYATGRVVTDAQGNLSLTFAVPPERFDLEVDAPNGLTGFVAYSVAMPTLGLRVGALTLGGPTEVKVSFAPHDDPWVDSEYVLSAAAVGLLPSPDQNWTEWSGGLGCAFEWLRGTNGGLNATFYLPAFLPKTGRYLVDAAASTGFGLREQFVVLSPGESADIPVGGTSALDLGTIALWATVGIILAAIAAVGIWVVLRRRPRTPPEPPPNPPTT